MIEKLLETENINTLQDFKNFISCSEKKYKKQEGSRLLTDGEIQAYMRGLYEAFCICKVILERIEE